MLDREQCTATARSLWWTQYRFKKIVIILTFVACSADKVNQFSHTLAGGKQYIIPHGRTLQQADEQQMLRGSIGGPLGVHFVVPDSFGEQSHTVLLVEVAYSKTCRKCKKENAMWKQIKTN